VRPPEVAGVFEVLVFGVDDPPLEGSLELEPPLVEGVFGVLLPGTLMGEGLFLVEELEDPEPDFVVPDFKA
jgi:hypothetical protein